MRRVNRALLEMQEHETFWFEVRRRWEGVESTGFCPSAIEYKTRLHNTRASEEQPRRRRSKPQRLGLDF